MSLSRSLQCPCPTCFRVKSSHTYLQHRAILLSTSFPKLSLLSTNALVQSTPAFADAHTLLRVWANQRGYGEGCSLCIHGFVGKGALWASILSFVLEGEEPVSVLGKGKVGRRSLGKGLSSYQLFRASLDFLGNVLFLPSDVCRHTDVTVKQDFEKAPVFVNFGYERTQGKQERDPQRQAYNHSFSSRQKNTHPIGLLFFSSTRPLA